MKAISPFKLLILIYLTSSLSPSQASVAPVAVVHGLIADPVEAVPYESFVPLIYKVPIPTGSELTTWVEHINNTQFLNVFRVTKQLLNQLRPSSIPRTRRDSSLFPGIGKLYNWLFGTSTQESTDILQANQEHLNTFAKTLEAQIIAEHKNSITSTHLVNDHFTELENAVSETRNFTENSVRHLQEEEEIVGTELLFTAIEGRQEIVTLSFVHAVAQCEQGLLSRYFVPEGTLSSDLRALSHKLRHHSQSLAFTHGTGKYYSTPGLTHCTFSGSSAIVSVRVPVRPLRNSYSVHSLLPLPFAYNNTVCQIHLQAKYAVVRNQDVVPISPFFMDQCPISRNSLCRVPRYDPPFIKEQACLETIFQSGPVSSIRQNCHYTCAPYIRPHVMAIGSNRFYVLTQTENATVQCTKSPSQLLPSTFIGNSYVSLPCDCSLQVGERTFTPDYPCLNALTELQVQHVIPGIMTNLDSFILHNSTQFASIHSIVDHQWKHKVSHINLTVPDLPTPAPWEFYHIPITTYTSYVTATALAIIGFIVLVILYRTFCVAAPLAMLPTVHANPLGIVNTTCEITEALALVAILLLLMHWYMRHRYSTYESAIPPLQPAPRLSQPVATRRPIASTFNWTP